MKSQATASTRSRSTSRTSSRTTLPISNEVELFTAAFEERIPVLLKGPTGCGKTRFVEYMAWRLGRPLIGRPWRPEGPIGDGDFDAGAADHHRRLPRRPDGQRPRRPLPARGRDDALDRWAADPRREGRRHLLPGRGRRGAQGHDRPHPPAHRLPAPAADREARPGPRGGRRLPARHLLQPGLPERAQGPQAQHAPALHLLSSSTTRPATRRRRSSRTRPVSTQRVANDLAKLGEKVRNLREHGLARA